MTKKIKQKWSIKENIGHLSDLDDLHIRRVDDFIRSRKELQHADMTNYATNYGNHNRKHSENILTTFAEKRIRFLSMIDQLDDTVLSRKAMHPRLKVEINVYDMLYFIAEHDLHHLGSIRLIMDTFEEEKVSS